MMTHVDLCSGIGGFALGFQWAGLSKPVLFCDIEPWSRQILRKHWPDVIIAEDVKDLANDPDGLVPDCDILTAGYPCQPFSLAGERRGDQDDRHIWPYIFSIVQRKRPSWCVFENVYGHVSMGLDEVLSDLEGESYATRPFIVPACATDAPHRRDRLWIICRDVADTISARGEAWASNAVGNGDGSRSDKKQLKSSGSSNNVANADSQRQQGSWLHGRPQHQTQNKNRQTDRSDDSSQGNSQLWLPEPSVGRVANGIPRRVDRLKGLGNAIVPQIAQRIGQTIKQCEALA